MRHRTAVAACAVVFAVTATGCSADPDEWLAENCLVSTGVLRDGEQRTNPITYLMGVGHADQDAPLYESLSGGKTVTLREEPLPADQRVCFNAEAWMESEVSGGGSVTVMPVAWSDEPEWDHYVKIAGQGQESNGACHFDVEKTDAPCEDGEGFFHVDRKKSAHLQKG